MLKESTKQYPKEVTIPNTNHGNDFQIHETMFYAFYYAYEKDIAFKLSTENTEYGKFDDIVLIKDSGEVMAMQLKHSKNNEPLVISDFIGKNLKGKFNFGKYLISLIDAHIISYDSTIIPPHIRLKFITNQIYPSEIKNFLKEKPYHLSCEFFDNSSVYSPIFDDIHRVVSSKYSLTNFKKIIRNFLERIEFITTVNNIELAEELKIKIKEKFNTTNDTLYHTFFYEFYRWLLTLSPNNTGEYYTKDDIKFLFEKWYQKYILLERLVGLSKNELHKINQSEKLKLNKKTELDILTGQIENNKIVLVSGLPGIGKSTIIKQYIEEKKLVDGQYLYLNINQLNYLDKIKTINDLETLKLLFIDDVELIYENDSLYFQFNKLIKKQINFFLDLKLILLIREDKENNLTRFCEKVSNQINLLKVGPVTTNNIIKALQNSKDFHAAIPHFLNAQNYLQNKEGFSLLNIPFYLNLFLININNSIKQRNLQYYLINSHIKRQNHNKSGFIQEQSLLIKERKICLRQLVFSKSNSNESYVSLPDFVNVQAIKSLLEDGIITVYNEKYDFAHRLYEEWTLNHIIQKKMRQIIEEKRKPKTLFKYFSIYLTKYHSYDLTQETNEKIYFYNKEQLINNEKETIKYLVKKRFVSGLLWLMNHSFKLLEDNFLEMIVSSSMPETMLLHNMVKPLEMLSSNIFVNDEQKFKHSYQLLNCLNNLYNACKKSKNQNFDEIKNRFIDLEAEVFLENIPLDYTIKEIIIQAREELKKYQLSQDHFFICSVFSQEGLFSLYELSHKLSNKINWSAGENNLWCASNIKDGFDSCNIIPCQIIAELFSALCVLNSSINSIELVHLKINDDAVANICEALLENNILYLENLNLHYNNINNDGVFEILKLSKICFIKELHLGYNSNINDDSVKSLVKIILFPPLPDTQFIECLDLSGTSLSDAAMILIEAAGEYKNAPIIYDSDRIKNKKNISYDFNFFKKKEDDYNTPTCREMFLMFAIEEHQIAFITDFLKTYSIDLERPILYSRYADCSLGDEYISPLHYARFLWETDEKDELLKILQEYIVNQSKISHSTFHLSNTKSINPVKRI